MFRVCLSSHQVLTRRSPTPVVGPRPGGPAVGAASVGSQRSRCVRVRRSALALLVAGVLADDHDPAVAADHLALVADLLDARLDLHRSLTALAGAGRERAHAPDR